MSILAFGRAVFLQTKPTQDFFGDTDCYMRFSPMICETTDRIVDQLFGTYDMSRAETFELSECLQGSTVQKLLAPKCYGKSDDAWKENEPTLYERLQTVQQCLSQFCVKYKPAVIHLCISEQGYPLPSDCNQLDVSLGRLAERSYEEYERCGGVPTVVITIYPCGKEENRP